jgi:hypothetical protein
MCRAMISPGFHLLVSRDMRSVRHLLTILSVPEMRETMPIVGAGILVIVILLVLFV